MLAHRHASRGGTCSGSVLDTTRWSHVASTFDGTWRLYVNGELRSSYETAFVFNSIGKFIGPWCGGSGWNWIGTIDEVRIDTRALGAEEIAARYEADLARFVRGDVNGDGARGCPTWSSFSSTCSWARRRSVAWMPPT
jgi:hypothetical protein